MQYKNPSQLPTKLNSVLFFIFYISLEEEHCFAHGTPLSSLFFSLSKWEKDVELKKLHHDHIAWSFRKKNEGFSTLNDKQEEVGIKGRKNPSKSNQNLQNIDVS